MKTLGLYKMIWMFILIMGWTTTYGQREIEVPGDNFSLEGALELFKKSSSPQEFEQMLNDPESRVNNLDLNGDGYIDYIKVVDMYEGNVHVFVIQALVAERESQDVAVITLEKLSNGKAVLQITGDEDIYGVETIIEPTREVYSYAGTTSSRVVVNVWSWPIVRYVYGPYYSVWVSPWGWGYRPYWWHPWRPVVYYDYYSYWSPYRHYYSVCHTHRVVYAHHIYRPHRSTSVIVHERHNDRIAHYRSTHIDTNGRYRSSGDRYTSRPSSSSVRYDGNGRIVSGSNQRLSSGSSSSDRTFERGIEGNRRTTSYQNNSSDIKRPESTVGNRQNYSNQRSSGLKRSETSDSWSGSSKRNNVTTRPKQTPVNMDRSESHGNSSIQRSGENSSINRSSGSSNVKRSSGNSSINRSSGNSSVQRSSGNANINRSSGSSNVQRSSGNANINRSSGSSNVQRSSGSSNVNRSSGNSSVQRSSGSSNINRSSGSSNVQRSNGSSNINRSSGNSNVQRSSGNSSINRSSGSSNVRRSSGNSSAQRSSGNSGKNRSSGRNN